MIDRVEPVEAGAPTVACAFPGDVPALALGDGAVWLDGARLAAHPDGAILCAASDGKRLVTGGDDGRVVEVAPGGAMREIAREAGWVDALALGPDGALAIARAKRVRAIDRAGAAKDWEAPSSVRGLAYFPKGHRLVVAHYGGASLWFPNVAGPPKTLAWKGAHIDATVSPDGRFLVTSMQENALHGWRVADGRDMRMTGYPAKSRSLAWSHDGRWLATSGAEACVVWPFADKDGPMGKPPRELGVRPSRVTACAFHPKAPVLAIGYADGFVLLVRFVDGSELAVRRETGGAVGAMAWDAAGTRLLFGDSGGRAGLLRLP
ncbi:MAG: WD40 repeat domain-containing protein [Hyphomicrobiales bacterium]|nr:WD40 repeat domain-containing protein [Hyphomicrobiales bacterium]MDE2017104.1 WD40 repeat domain-containing protein [Hyphomicrobiales bacterium]